MNCFNAVPDATKDEQPRNDPASITARQAGLDLLSIRYSLPPVNAVEICGFRVGLFW